MTIHLRPAVLADCLALAEIHAEGWRSAYAGFMPAGFLAGLDPEEQAQDFRAWFFDPARPCIGLVAEEDGQAVGFVFAGLNEGDPPGYDSEVFKLFVRPGWQNQGIGQRLMDAALDALRAMGYHKVAIWTFQQARSGDFYRKLGYEIVFQTHIEFNHQRWPVDIYGGAL